MTVLAGATVAPLSRCPASFRVHDRPVVWAEKEIQPPGFTAMTIACGASSSDTGR